jgi:asparagine synthase (glutamine-hydrolysing)
MSGIAGIIHFDGKPVEPGLIERMTSAMAHRGPDGINHWVNGSVALGQRMLRTTPESLEELQPLTNEDESLVLVMDGRVDNWEELRKDLLARGAVLRNRSDAELVLRAYEVWGKNCVAQIEGDFALVIWDARRRQAFCARDRVGIKPFNYHWDGKTLTFASELHAILALPWVPEIPNVGILAEFVANEWYSRDETFLQGILRLVAAHHGVADSCGMHPKKYWEPDFSAAYPADNDESYVEHYRELFSDVVRRMSRSHKPIACEVSGGPDSSAIFAMAERLRRNRQLRAPGLEGYTLAFTGNWEANELHYARAVGDHLRTDIHEVGPSKMSLGWYREWARRYREFPSFPNGVMGLGIRHQAVSRGCRALFGGVGGDEWLSGSRSYYAEALAEGQWKTLGVCLGADRRAVGFAKTLWWVSRHGWYPLLPDRVRRSVRAIIEGVRGSGIAKQTWLTPEMARQIRTRRDQSIRLGTETAQRVGKRQQMLALSYAYSSHALENEERMASSIGIEQRQPFLNARLIQFCVMTPERLRLRGRLNKYLHRKAMAGLLPQVVLMREDKADFMITFRWHLSEIRDVFFGGSQLRANHWVDVREVQDIYDQAGRIQEPGWREWLLWTLFGCTVLLSSY